jgi:hypothetical protein
LWSAAVLDELTWVRREMAVRRGTPRVETDAYLVKLVEAMTGSFPDALVEGWERGRGEH